jgi:hypothetical protein
MTEEILKWITGILNINITRNGITYGNIDTLIQECEENLESNLDSTLTLNENTYKITINLTKTIPEETETNTTD